MWRRGVELIMEWIVRREYSAGGMVSLLVLVGGGKKKGGGKTDLGGCSASRCCELLLGIRGLDEACWRWCEGP